MLYDQKTCLKKQDAMVSRFYRMGMAVMDVRQVGMFMLKKRMRMDMRMGQAPRHAVWMVMSMMTVVVTMAMVVRDGLMGMSMPMLFTEQEYGGSHHER